MGPDPFQPLLIPHCMQPTSCCPQKVEMLRNDHLEGWRVVFQDPVYNLNQSLYDAVSPARKPHESGIQEVEEAAATSTPIIPNNTFRGLCFPNRLEVLFPKRRTLLPGDTATVPLSYVMAATGHLGLLCPESNKLEKSHHPDRGNPP